MEEKKPKRRLSSILKKSPHRKSLIELDQNTEILYLPGDDEVRRGGKRRVSFARTNQVKEIPNLDEIVQQWPDSSESSIDTTNIAIKNLAVSKKKKNEVGAESLNVLLSAPIVQNDTISASDIALLDATESSLMDVTDCSAILNTPRDSSQNLSNTRYLKSHHESVSLREVPASSETCGSSKPASGGVKPFSIDDIPVVVPSFLKKYLKDDVGDGANPEASKLLTNDDMQETVCIKRSSFGDLSAISNPAKSTARRSVLFTDDDIEMTGCFPLESTSNARYREELNQPVMSSAAADLGNSQNKENIFPTATSSLGNLKRNQLQSADERNQPRKAAAKSFSVDDIPVVVPSFLQKYMKNGVVDTSIAVINDSNLSDVKIPSVVDGTSPYRNLNSSTATKPAQTCKHNQLISTDETNRSQIENLPKILSIDDIPVVVPTFIQKYMKNEVVDSLNINSDDREDSTVRMPLASKPSLNQTSGKPSSEARSDPTRDDDAMEETVCIKRRDVVDEGGNVEAPSRDSGGEDRTVIFDNDVDIEVIKCLRADSAGIRDDAPDVRAHSADAFPNEGALLKATCDESDVVELTRCLPCKSAAEVVNTESDMEFTKCVIPVVSCKEQSFNERFNVNHPTQDFPPKSHLAAVRDVSRNVTFNNGTDMEITQCLQPKSSAVFGIETSVTSPTGSDPDTDLTITKCLPVRLLQLENRGATADNQSLPATLFQQRDVSDAHKLNKEIMDVHSVKETLLKPACDVSDGVDLTRCLLGRPDMTDVISTVSDMEFTKCVIPNPSNIKLTQNNNLYVFHPLQPVTSETELAASRQATSANGGDMEITQCLPPRPSALSDVQNSLIANTDKTVTKHLPVPVQQLENMDTTANNQLLPVSDSSKRHLNSNDSTCTPNLFSDKAFTPLQKDIPSKLACYDSDEVDLTRCLPVRSDVNDVLSNVSDMEFTKCALPVADNTKLTLNAEINATHPLQPASTETELAASREATFADSCEMDVTKCKPSQLSNAPNFVGNANVTGTESVAVDLLKVARNKVSTSVKKKLKKKNIAIAVENNLDVTSDDVFVTESHSMSSDSVPKSTSVKLTTKNSSSSLVSSPQEDSSRMILSGKGSFACDLTKNSACLPYKETLSKSDDAIISVSDRHVSPDVVVPMDGRANKKRSFESDCNDKSTSLIVEAQITKNDNFIGTEASSHSAEIQPQSMKTTQDHLPPSQVSRKLPASAKVIASVAADVPAPMEVVTSRKDSAPRENDSLTPVEFSNLSGSFNADLIKQIDIFSPSSDRNPQNSPANNPPPPSLSSLSSPSSADGVKSASQSPLLVKRSFPTRTSNLSAYLHESATASGVEFASDEGDVSSKRLKLASSFNSQLGSASSIFNQETAENISMEDFLTGYVNVRIGEKKKASRGKQSLAFSTNSQQKPKTLSQIVRLVSDQEYEAPVYTSFQQSILQNLQRAEKKIATLEQEIEASNPDVIKKIRFGDSEEAAKLIARIEDLARQCKANAKAQWKMAKNKLRKSLHQSWKVMLENEGISSFLEELRSHGNIEQLLEKAEDEVINMHQHYKSKIADLPKEEDLPTDDQIAAYRRNRQKIDELKQALEKQEQEKRKYETEKKEFNDVIDRVWKKLDEQKRNAKKIEKKPETDSAEKERLKKYILWDVVAYKSDRRVFSFFDETLIFSAKFSQSDSAWNFDVDSTFKVRKLIDLTAYKFVHHLIHDDDDIQALKRQKIAEFDRAKEAKIFSLLSRKVACAAALRREITRLSMLVSRVSLEFEKSSIVANFYNRHPNLCSEVDSFHTSSYDYVNDPISTFGRFSEGEILRTLDESNSSCSSFPHLCSALLKMIDTPPH